MGPFLVSEGQQHVPVSRVSVGGLLLRTRWAGSIPTALLRVRSSWSPRSECRRVQQLSRCSDASASFAVPRLWNHHQICCFLGGIVWSCSVVVCLVPCHLGWVYVQLDFGVTLTCWSALRGSLLSFLINDQAFLLLCVISLFSMRACHIFRCSTVRACASSSPAVMVAVAKESCSYSWMYSLYCTARSVVSPGT